MGEGMLLGLVGSGPTGLEVLLVIVWVGLLGAIAEGPATGAWGPGLIVEGPGEETAFPWESFVSELQDR